VEQLPILLGAGCAVALAGLLLAAGKQKVWGSLFPLLSVSGVLAVAALWTKEPIQRSALLEMASFLTLVLVWRVATRRVAWIYSVAVAISAVSLFAGQKKLAKRPGS
jgi:hypothetical protein